MFDTRAGFWLMASLGIAGLVSTVATIMFAPDSSLTYYTFAKAIGFPMTVILPIIAVLAITSEWSQRTGLTTFTLVPHRGRVIRRQGDRVAGGRSPSRWPFALAIGVLGNVIGPAVAGTEQVWDVSAAHAAGIVPRQPALPAHRDHARDPRLQLARWRWSATSSHALLVPNVSEVLA